ncbi:hypothetical protein M3697_02585 [Janibacter melonis]|uniref:hypothetical protein n=1 Tax=Janibacter melonis TaxID=262209 RepID=UPI002042F8E0|nr:hypothetical protein [Janibacter melonis]MCM3554002.1 hypothetical protein [Janibacter melonis]
MTVAPADVLAFLGQPEDAGAIGLPEHISTATAMVKAYTRGRGFTDDGEPQGDVRAVIVSSAARLHRNPTLDRNQSAGPFTHAPGTFNGWTLPELAVLHRYRTRAQ